MHAYYIYICMHKNKIKRNYRFFLLILFLLVVTIFQITTFQTFDSPTKLDEIFKVTSVPLFISDFNLLSCELDNFIFKMFLLSCFMLISYKRNYIYNTLTVSFKRSKIFQIFYFFNNEKKSCVSTRSRFAVKLICCTAFGSAANVCCSIRSIAIILQ